LVRLLANLWFATGLGDVVAMAPTAACAHCYAGAAGEDVVDPLVERRMLPR
jgi:hypothetical protein